MSGLPAKLARASPDDADAIRDLVRAAYAKWVPVIGREPRPMIADYAEKLGTFRFDLVRLGGALVGLIETQSRNDHYWIENVAVHPGRQGEGHGIRLMAHAEALAAAAPGKAKSASSPTLPSRPISPSTNASATAPPTPSPSAMG